MKQIKYLLGRERVHDVIREQRENRSPGRAPGAPGLNCLVLGGGGREYAIAWRLARCDSVATIDVVPGNAGMDLFARRLEFDPTDHHRLEQHVLASFTDLAVIGTDEYVEAGLADVLRRARVSVVGPSREAGRIEWSKSFAKELMAAAGVPTASWERFASAADARAAVERRREGPLVVKADGLAAGKGVVVAADRAHALEALGTPPISGGPVVLEEALTGPEASLQALVDGKTVVALPPAQDHKRVGEGDTGPNTGGMGAFSPTPVLPDDEAADAATELIAPVARRLAELGTPFRGVLYAGLIRTAAGWRVLEYNARFGDPEAQVTLPRVGGDFAKVLAALAEGRLAEFVREHPLRFSERAYVDVALCAEGYPGPPRTGQPIEVGDLPDGVYAFHAATRRSGDAIVTAGGRVMHIVAGGDTVADARARAYAAAERVRFAGKFYRSDIAAEGVGITG
ncbi:MAG TPA: phosphoribosylamine--glycine ligase [Candidatus Limnocylindrales bacterium]|nr:phosphoribosylamine--glycine ligase [Candidatus Limnocylindrales bacterium]